jgi:hypothetical protein
VNSDKHYSSDAQRYLDGEPHGQLSEAERADADRLLHAVEAYAARLSAPAADIDDSVIEQIRAAGPRSRGWRWIFEPHAIRVRPIWVPLAAAAVVALVWLGGGEAGPAEPAVAPVTVANDTIFVHFQLVAPEARQVAIAGSFSDWLPDELPLVKENGGLWSITLALPIGEHQYQFVIDGERWIPDPRAHAQVDDGFGGTNSVVIVGPRGVVQS